MLAAGGVGLGPILFLARSLEAARVATGASGDRTRPRLSAPLVVGFRATDLVPDIAFPPGFVLCTDDGSAGTKGTPVDWMAHNAPAAGARLYACGPSPMLAAIARLAASRGWAASLSAEQWMACGVGGLHGIASSPALPARVSSGPAPDGPVFELGDIDWERKHETGHERAHWPPPPAQSRGNSLGDLRLRLRIRGAHGRGRPRRHLHQGGHARGAAGQPGAAASWRLPRACSTR